MNPEQQSFLDYIAQCPWQDETPRLIYADWLEEHDMIEEANRQREIVPAMRWVHVFVKSINYGRYEEKPPYNKIPGSEKEEDPHSYDGMIQAGYSAIDGSGYCFGTDAGADFFREGQSNREEFFRNWSIITGVAVPQDVIDDPPFRCAC